ncbi:MAG: phage tail assembly protein [Alphaproteobacteria bacterium]|nr:phage tail assembly protein [Alphaproteobacteria bacterium]
MSSLTAEVNLSMPLGEGERKVDKLALRRPSSGELRGISIQKLIEMDITTVLVVLPRISMTPLSPQMVNQIDPADLISVGEAISGFFTPLKTSSFPTMSSPPGA